MIRKFLLGMAFLSVGAIGAVGTQHSWFGVGDWYNEPSVSDFQTLVVTDFNTAYTVEEFLELGGTIDAEGNIVVGSAVCPKTGSDEFKKVVARTRTDFWGSVIGFDLAASYQQKLRIKKAKGDMNWSEFEKAFFEAKSEEATTEGASDTGDSVETAPTL